MGSQPLASDQTFILMLIGTVVAIVSLVAGAWMRVEFLNTKSTKDTKEYIDLCFKEVLKRIDQTMNRADVAYAKAELAQDNLLAYQVVVAREYAQIDFIDKVENRFVERFNALVTKFESIVKELHIMNVDFAKRRAR